MFFCTRVKAFYFNFIFCKLPIKIKSCRGFVNFWSQIGHHKAQNSYIIFSLLHSLCCPHMFLDLKILMFPCAPIFRHFDDRLHGAVLFEITKLLNL